MYIHIKSYMTELSTIIVQKQFDSQERKPQL